MNVREFGTALEAAAGRLSKIDISEDAEVPVVVRVPGLGPCKVTAIEMEEHSDSFAGAKTLWLTVEEM